MGRQREALLLAAVLCGVLAPTPGPGLLLLAAGAAALWRLLGGRWGVVALLGLFLLSGVLTDRAWEGTAHPVSGPVDGVLRLLTDPRPLPGGGHRAEVRLEGHRYDAEFPATVEVGGLLAGEGLEVRGRLDGDPWRWQRIRHVGGTLEVFAVGEALPAGPVHRLANALRRTLARGAASLPPEQAALLTGLVLGDDRAQDARTADDFRAAGLGHLLAVSGQNVALVVAAASPLLHRLRFRSRLPATVLVLAFFALVTRFEPSVLRATVMAGGSALAAARGRESEGLRLLCVSVAGLLLVDPLLVHRAAFQLSVSACAGILLGASRLSSLLPGPRPLREAASVTLAAQAAVAPILLLLFGPVPVAAFPANLLAAPVAGPVMVWGITGGLAAGVLGPPVDALLHLPTSLGLGWIGGLAAWAGRHPIGLLGGVGALAASALVALAAGGAHRDRPSAGRVALGGLAMILLGTAVATLVHDPGRGAAGGLRLLDSVGRVVVVDRSGGAERLLADLRQAGVHAPMLLVFREPVATEVAEALRSRYPGVELWGPPNSDGVGTPPAGTVLEVDGDRWTLDHPAGHLRVRRLAPP